MAWNDPNPVQQQVVQEDPSKTIVKLMKWILVFQILTVFMLINVSVHLAN